MRKYPAYTWASLRRESAIIFFTLLRHAHRFDAMDTREAIMIALIGDMEQANREQTLDYYSNASQDILEDVEGLTDSGDYSAIEILKKGL